MTGWIDVNEQSPGEGAIVVGMIPTNKYLGLLSYSDGKFWGWPRVGPQSVSPKYWLYIPEAPGAGEVRLP